MLKSHKAVTAAKGKHLVNELNMAIPPLNSCFFCYSENPIAEQDANA